MPVTQMATFTILVALCEPVYTKQERSIFTKTTLSYTLLLINTTKSTCHHLDFILGVNQIAEYE